MWCMYVNVNRKCVAEVFVAYLFEKESIAFMCFGGAQCLESAWYSLVPFCTMHTTHNMFCGIWIAYSAGCWTSLNYQGRVVLCSVVKWAFLFFKRFKERIMHSCCYDARWTKKERQKERKNKKKEKALLFQKGWKQRLVMPTQAAHTDPFEDPLTLSLPAFIALLLCSIPESPAAFFFFFFAFLKSMVKKLPSRYSSDIQVFVYSLLSLTSSD